MERWKEQAAGVPEWFVTFADMMTLLLTFFIMLVSMSEVKEDEKFHAMVDSMRQEFGHQGANATGGDRTPRNTNMIHTGGAGRAGRRDALWAAGQVKAVLGDDAEGPPRRLGQHASIVGVVPFDNEATSLSDEAKQFIEKAARRIEVSGQKVEIRGHASAKPLSAESTMRDKYDLAYERCREVMKSLVQQGIEPERIHYLVAADHHPQYEGFDATQQQLNARVQIVLWDEYVTPAD